MLKVNLFLLYHVISVTYVQFLQSRAFVVFILKCVWPFYNIAK